MIILLGRDVAYISHIPISTLVFVHARQFHSFCRILLSFASCTKLRYYSDSTMAATWFLKPLAIVLKLLNHWHWSQSDSLALLLPQSDLYVKIFASNNYRNEHEMQRRNNSWSGGIHSYPGPNVL